ncbi:Peptidase family U32 [compost metagenome]
MKKLSVPCNWNFEKAQQIAVMAPENDTMVYEMYGAISNDVFPTGRYKESMNIVNEADALRFKRDIVDKHGFNFAYLLNTPCSLELLNLQDLRKYLDWIIYDFKAQSLTISSLELMQFVRRHYPQVNINVSTIAGVQNIEEFNNFLEIQPSRIILHHNAVRNISGLKTLIAYAKEQGIKLELMLNESCLQNCKRRKEHYNCLALNQSDHKFHVYCNTIKVQQPYQLLMANFIRPEDIGFYAKLGVELFKVTGRSKHPDWLPEVVGAYLHQSYDGNLIRLLGIDPALRAEEWIKLSNRGLAGFLENWPEEDQENYCKTFITNMYRNGEITMHPDYAETCLRNGELVSKVKGDLYAHNVQFQR